MRLEEELLLVIGNYEAIVESLVTVVHSLRRANKELETAIDVMNTMNNRKEV